MGTINSADFLTYTDQIAAQVETYNGATGNGIDGYGSEITAADGAQANVGRIIALADHEIINDLFVGFQQQFNKVSANPLMLQYAIEGAKSLNSHVAGTDAFLTANRVRIAPEFKYICERILGELITAANTYPPIFDKAADLTVTGINAGALSNTTNANGGLYIGNGLFAIKTSASGIADDLVLNLTCYKNFGSMVVGGTERIAVYFDTSDVEGAYKPILSDHETLFAPGGAAITSVAMFNPFSGEAPNFYIEKTSALAGAEAIVLTLTCTLASGVTEVKTVAVNASDIIGTVDLVGTHPDDEYTSVTFTSSDVDPAAANTWKIGFCNKFYAVALASVVSANGVADTFEIGNMAGTVEITAANTAVMSGCEHIDDDLYNGANWELEKCTAAGGAAAVAFVFTCTLADGTTEEKTVNVDASDAAATQDPIGTHVADKYIKVAISTITPPVCVVGTAGEIWKIVANQERSPAL